MLITFVVHETLFKSLGYFTLMVYDVTRTP